MQILNLQTSEAAHVFWHFNNWLIIEKMTKKMLDEYYLNNNIKCIEHKKTKTKKTCYSIDDSPCFHCVLQQFTLRQQGDEGVEWATVVSPAMQAEHRTTLVRTPHCASDLPPGNLNSQIWQQTNTPHSQHSTFPVWSLWHIFKRNLKLTWNHHDKNCGSGCQLASLFLTAWQLNIMSAYSITTAN